MAHHKKKRRWPRGRSLVKWLSRFKRMDRKKARAKLKGESDA